MKNLIGKKVRGFRFEGRRGYLYDTGMYSYEGKVGEIEEYKDKDEFYKVKFKDDYWFYPAELIEQHLVDHDLTEKIELYTDSIKEAIIKAYFNGTSLPQIRESIRQAYTAIEAGVNAQLVEIKEERGKI